MVIYVQLYYTDADLSVLKTYYGWKMYINVDSMFYSPPQKTVR